MTTGLTVVAVLYGITTFGVFVYNVAEWYETSYWHHTRRDYARRAVAAPFWPYTLARAAYLDLKDLWADAHSPKEQP